MKIPIYSEIRTAKKHSQQQSFLNNHFEMIKNGDLRKIRKIILACMAVEKIKIDEAYKSNLPSLLAHIKIQQVSISVSDLLLHGQIVKSVITSNLRKKKITYPLSAQWIDIFYQNGLPVRKYASLVKFYHYQIQKLLKNHAKAILIALHRNKKVFELHNNSALIHTELTESRVQLISPGRMSFTSWLKDKKIVEQNTEEIYFLRGNKSYLSNEIEVNQMFKFDLVKTLVDCYKLVSKSHFQFMKLFLIAPNLVLEYINLNEDISENISKLIIPSAQGWIKSTWHVKIEELGTEIIYVNLSDSSEPSMTFDQNFPVNWYFFSQWKNMSVCSDNQQLIIDSQRLGSNASKVKVLGVPDWQDSGELLIDRDHVYISVFDFEPQKGHYGFSCNNDSGYSDIQNTLKFIKSISDIAKKIETYVVYKPKRSVPDVKRYQEYKNTLKNTSITNKYFIVAEETIAPRRIILNSAASIQMPFTSTALIAKEHNISTCFYDIVGQVNSNDPGANGVKIIKSEKILTDWIVEQLKFSTLNR